MNQLNVGNHILALSSDEARMLEAVISDLRKCSPTSKAGSRILIQTQVDIDNYTLIAALAMQAAIAEKAA